MRSIRSAQRQVELSPLALGENTNSRFFRFFVHSVPLFHSMMLTPIEVSQSRDILTSHTFVTPYWRSSHSLPGMLWYGVDIVSVYTGS